MHPIFGTLRDINRYPLNYPDQTAFQTREKKQTTVVVLGASPNPARYSHRVTKILQHSGYNTIPIGRRTGHIDRLEIKIGKPTIVQVDTITLYLSPLHQMAYIDYIISLQPSRVIFNPGTENPAIYEKLRESNIEVLEACNLVMLSTGQF